MATRPMIFQTQFGNGLPPHGMSGPHNNMHRSSSQGHQGQAQRQRHDRNYIGSPVRIPGRRIPPRVLDAPPAAEYGRSLVRRRRSTSPPIGDIPPASYSTRHRHPVHVEYHNLRDDDVSRISETDARKQLTSYVVVRLQKRQTSDEHDDLGRAVQESWTDAVHHRVPDMGKEAIMAQIRSLNQREGGVAERKQNMSEFIQTQLEKAYFSLESRERDHRFDYKLDQFDKKSRKVERYELDHYEYTQARDLDKRQRGSSSKRRSKGSKSSFEHSKPSKHKYKQTVSVTAYFKREPKAHINCRQLLREMAMRAVRGEVDEVDEVDELEDEDEYGEDSFDDDGQSEVLSPRAPVHMPHHEGMQFRPMPLPPHHPVHPPHPQYAQHEPPPSFPHQRFDNAGPNGPMHPGGHQHDVQGGPPPGPPVGFGPQSHMQHPGPSNGPPPPPPLNTQRGPSNMGHPGGRPMGPPGGHPTGQARGHPMGPPGGHPMGPPEGHDMGPPEGRPMDQARGRPMDQARGHPTGPPGGHPTGPPGGHPMGPPGGRPMDQARGRPMGPPGGPPNEGQGGFPGGPPPPRHEPRPEEAGRRPPNHQGHSASLPHQPPPFRGPGGGADSSRSSSPDSVDRESWVADEDNSTEPSSIDPHSPPKRYAPYKPGDFGIHDEQRRSSPRPYLEDEGPFTRRPQERSSMSPPRHPSRGPAGLHQERRSRERIPPPRFAKETRGHDHTRRSRRDDDVNDVEERLGRMGFGGDNRRDRDRSGRQDHERRRSRVRSRNRGEHSRTPEYRHRGHSPSHGGYERRSLRRSSDDSRERYHRRPEGGGRGESHRRDRADSYEPRYRNVSPRRHGQSRYRDDAHHHQRR